jgi:hypothetical protein
MESINPGELHVSGLVEAGPQPVYFPAPSATETIPKPGAAVSSEDTAKAPKTSASEGEAKAAKPAGRAEISPTANDITKEIVKVLAAAGGALTAVRAAQATIELAGIQGLVAGEMPASVVLTEAGAWAGPLGGVVGAFTAGFLVGSLIVDAFPAVGSAPAEWLYNKLYR